MASIRKRGSTYSFRVSYKDDSGKFKVIERGGFETKREAELAGNKFEIELKENKNILKGETPLYKYFEEYYYLKKHDNVGLGTRVIYKRTLRVIQKHFKEAPINTITNATYQGFINSYGDGRAKSTVQKVHNQVRSCFRYAHANGVISIDPTYDIDIYYTEKAKSRKLMYLNENELQNLTKEIKNNLSADDSVKHFILLLIASGARFSELLALTYDDYDYNNRTINITKSFDHQYSFDFKPTKNKSSIRKITIDTATNELIKSFIDYKQENENKKKNPKGFLFFNEETRLPYSHTAIQKQLTRLCKKAKIKHITLHALRHTHASILLLHNVGIEYIAHRLGHSDTDTTQKFYLHLLDEMKERSEDKLAEIFANY